MGKRERGPVGLGTPWDAGDGELWLLLPRGCPSGQRRIWTREAVLALPIRIQQEEGKGTPSVLLACHYSRGSLRVSQEQLPSCFMKEPRVEGGGRAGSLMSGWHWLRVCRIPADLFLTPQASARSPGRSSPGMPDPGLGWGPAHTRPTSLLSEGEASAGGDGTCTPRL